MNCISRRGWILTGLALPSVAATAPETLPVRKIAFEVRPQGVFALLRADELLAADDPDAMGLLTSGFVIRLSWHLELYRRERTGRTLRNRLRLQAKMYWDPWASIFVLHLPSSAPPVQVAYYRDPVALLHAALRPAVRIAGSDELERGGTRYFLRVLAMRNPFASGQQADGSLLENDGAIAGVAAGVDGSFWSFPRLVALFSRRPARAEVVVEYRTNDFFLGETP